MAKPKHSLGQRLLSFLIFAAALVLTSPIWFPVFGTALLVPDQLQKVDAIVVMRGEEYFRLGKAAELYKQGMAPVLVASVVPGTASQSFDIVRLLSGYDKFSETELTLKMFDYFGVKPEAVLFTGAETTSTYDEARATLALAKEKGFRSFILVTSTYHMRRSLMIFRSVFQGSEIEIYPVTAPAAELYDPLHWWTRERDVRRVAEEYPSLIFNWVYHFVLKKHSTSFDTV